VAFVLLAMGMGSAEASPPVQAARAVRSAGRCTGGDSTYVLSLSRYDRNTLRVRFAIAHSTPGHSWQIFGSDDRIRIFAVKRTVGAGGTLSVRRRIKDRRGPDHVKVAASDAASGEACSAGVKGF